MRSVGVEKVETPKAALLTAWAEKLLGVNLNRAY